MAARPTPGSAYAPAEREVEDGGGPAGIGRNQPGRAGIRWNLPRFAGAAWRGAFFDALVASRAEATLQHPVPIRPLEHAQFRADKMGKSTLFQSERMLVGLNAFEPGQEHRLHAHEGMDKLYHVLAGTGVCLLEGREEPLEPGTLLVAPAGVPHGLRNSGAGRLVVLAVLAPAPGGAPR